MFIRVVFKAAIEICYCIANISMLYNERSCDYMYTNETWQYNKVL